MKSVPERSYCHQAYVSQQTMLSAEESQHKEHHNSGPNPKHGVMRLNLCEWLPNRSPGSELLPAHGCAQQGPASSHRHSPANPSHWYGSTIPIPFVWHYHLHPISTALLSSACWHGPHTQCTRFPRPEQGREAPLLSKAVSPLAGRTLCACHSALLSSPLSADFLLILRRRGGEASWNQLGRRGCFLGKQKQWCWRDAGGAAGPSVQRKEPQLGTRSPLSAPPSGLCPISEFPSLVQGRWHAPVDGCWEGGVECGRNGKGTVQPGSPQTAQEGAGGLFRASKHHQMWAHPTPRPTRGILSLGWGSLSPQQGPSERRAKSRGKLRRSMVWNRGDCSVTLIPLS